MLMQNPRMTIGSLPLLTVSLPKMLKAMPPTISPIATKMPLTVARALASLPKAYVKPKRKPVYRVYTLFCHKTLAFYTFYCFCDDLRLTTAELIYSYAGSVDGRPEAQLDPGVEEGHAQQHHVTGHEQPERNQER